MTSLTHISLLRRKRLLSFFRLRESLFGCVLMIQLFILFVLPSLRSMGVALPHAAIYTILLLFVLSIAILSRSPWAVGAVLASLVLAISGTVWRHENATMTAQIVNDAGHLLTELSLLWIVSTAVFGSGRVTVQRIIGAIVMYLCIGMIFATLDLSLVEWMPSAFSNMPTDHFALRDAMNYFSFSALTTCNFGNIAPLHPLARSLAMIETIVGQMFPPIFLARIVKQHESWQEKKRPARQALTA